jgi:hypothetical protein
MTNALAELFQSKGEYDRALPLYEECLAKQKRVLVDEHPRTKDTQRSRDACGLWIKVQKIHNMRKNGHSRQIV